MGGNPPETPIEDAAAELNATLEVSGSTEESDGNVADAEQSMDTSGTLEQGETIDGTEVIPRTSVMGEARAPVSEDEDGDEDDDDDDEEEEESSSAESVGSGLSDSNITLDSDAIEEEHAPDTVLDENDIAGNEIVETEILLTTNLETEAQIESDAEGDAYQEIDVETKRNTEEDAEHLAEEAVDEHGFGHVMPEYEVEVETEDEPKAGAPLMELPESPSSPKNDGEESAEIMHEDMEVQEAQQQDEEGQLSSPKVAHDVLKRRNNESISATSGDEISSEQEDDDASSDNELEVDDDEDDGDDDGEKDDNGEEKVKRKQEIDPVLQLKKIQISAHPEEKIYYIRRNDGTVHAGHVLQSRPTESSDYPEEYYVHYLGLNRRLDGWVGRHRISENAEDLGGITVALPPFSDQPSTSSNSAVPRPNRQGNKDYYLGALENNRYDYSDRKMTRYQKRRYDEVNHVQKSQAELLASNVQLEKEHEAITKIKFIDKLIFGYYEINTWYFSPFPGEYGKARTIYVCEYCLKYMKLEKSYRFHLFDCKERQPPGKQIYRQGSIAIYEVIGREEPLYCQLLSLMAKLFLDHKALYYDMDTFLFYILCEIDNEGSHVVGYFSKDRVSMDNNNVACILVLPPHQRKGYGKLLIAFSYELSRKEGVIGSPEKPLSDLGRLSYRSYWAYTLLELMKERCSVGYSTIEELSEVSGITQDDIIYTLQSMKMIKYWKGQNTICVTLRTINELLQLPQFKRPKLTIDLDLLKWKPLSAAN